MPDADDNLWLSAFLLVILIICNAFFAMSEIAVITVNDNRIRRMAEEGNKKAATLAGFINDPSRFLATIQVGVTFSGFLASAFAADRFAGPAASLLVFTGLPYNVLHSIVLVLITIILSFFTLVFGELVPKRIGMANAEKIAFTVAPFLRLIAAVERPFASLLSATTNGFLKLLGVNPHAEQAAYTEEEIRMMVDVGNEKGVIEESEKEMINNVFEFDDKIASDIMTHRTELVAIDIDSPLSDVVALAVDEGYSRIPVYTDDIDHIVGILYVKDLLALMNCETRNDVKVGDIMRPAMYVPESNRCTLLFQEFKTKKIQMAVVIDEYGGTAGIVTMEDLVESIVGNIQDEYDDEEEEIHKLSDTEYTFDGTVSLDEVEKLLGISVSDKSDYDTLGGLITDVLGRIPNTGETPVVEIQGIRFTVQLVEDKRIAKVGVVKLLPAESGDKPDPQEAKAV